MENNFRNFDYRARSPVVTKLEYLTNISLCKRVILERETLRYLTINETSLKPVLRTGLQKQSVDKNEESERIPLHLPHNPCHFSLFEIYFKQITKVRSVISFCHFIPHLLQVSAFEIESA